MRALTRHPRVTGAALYTIELSLESDRANLIAYEQTRPKDHFRSAPDQVHSTLECTLIERTG
jgi:hypothetical protein